MCIHILVLVCLGGVGGLQNTQSGERKWWLAIKTMSQEGGGKRSGIAEWADMHSDSCMITNPLGAPTGSQLPHQQNRDLNRVYIMGSVSVVPSLCTMVLQGSTANSKSIHVAENGIISFILMGNTPFYLYTDTHTCMHAQPLPQLPLLHQHIFFLNQPTRLAPGLFPRLGYCK